MLNAVNNISATVLSDIKSPVLYGVIILAGIGAIVWAILAERRKRIKK